MLGNAKAKSIDIKSNGIVITGDFNYPDINWLEDGTAIYDTENESSMESNFIETIYDNFLFQNISDFTFLRKEKPISTLDLIFTDSDSLIDYVELRPPLAALENGHLCIDFGIGIGEKNQATNYISGRKLAYQRAECHKIESELLELDWPKLLVGDANMNYETFLNILNGIVRKWTP